MNRVIVNSSEPITLVGGGDYTINDVNSALLFAPCLVAADGGAAGLIGAGILPEAVIGDMDSLDMALAAQIPDDRVHKIAEQDSTDFDKALRSMVAPLVLAVGFTGARIDHQLAALNVLVRRVETFIVIVGPEELIFLLPRTIVLPTEAGDVVSLMPMRAVAGRSEGLEWPIDGIAFAPGGTVGTSNRAQGAVRLTMDQPGMLGIIPRARLAALVPILLGIEPDARWPSRA